MTFCQIRPIFIIYYFIYKCFCMWLSVKKMGNISEIQRAVFHPCAVTTSTSKGLNLIDLQIYNTKVLYLAATLNCIISELQCSLKKCTYFETLSLVSVIPNLMHDELNLFGTKPYYGPN